MSNIESQKWIQENLFNVRNDQPEQFYIGGKRDEFYPSQVKYLDNRFAVIQMNDELRVLSKENFPRFYNAFLNNYGYRHIYFKSEWVDNPEVVLNPEKLTNLSVIKGADLEEARRDQIGGKSLGEVELKQYEHFGFKVPNQMVVPKAFYDILQNHGFLSKSEAIMKSYSSAEDIVNQDGTDPQFMDIYVPKRIEKLFESLNYFETIFIPFISPEIRRFYLDNYKKGDKFNFIMRSSSPLEDGEKNLFQGVFDSKKICLSVHEEEDLYSEMFYMNIYEEFQRVMLSPWTTYAESYLRDRNLVGGVSRSLAIIFQVVPKNLEFIGRAYFDGNQTEVEYIDQMPDSGNYVGNRIYIENGRVIKRMDDVKDYGNRELGDFGKLMVDEKAIEIANIMEKLSVVFPSYKNKFNIELGVTKDGIIYAFQIRPTRREPLEDYVPDLSQVDRGKMFFECSAYNSPFSRGKIIGPVINMLGYKHAYRGEVQDGYLEEISKRDKKYPGSIFIVRLNIPSIKKINILTPNRSGIIVCYEHDSLTRNDHCVEELYSDPKFHIINVLPELFKDFKDGMRLGVVSNGKKAVFYKPDNFEIDSLIYETPTVLATEKNYDNYQNEKYFQDELPLRTKRIKKI